MFLSAAAHAPLPHLPPSLLAPPPRSGGTLGGILPLLAVFYAVMLKSWTGAVDDLALHYDPSHAHRMSVAGSLDEDDSAGGSAAPAGLPPLDGDAAPQRQPAPVY